MYELYAYNFCLLMVCWVAYVMWTILNNLSYRLKSIYLLPATTTGEFGLQLSVGRRSMNLTYTGVRLTILEPVTRLRAPNDVPLRVQSQVVHAFTFRLICTGIISSH